MSWRDRLADLLAWPATPLRRLVGDLEARVIELERRLAAVQDQAALRMAGVERRAALLSHENEVRLQSLERRVGAPTVNARLDE